MRALKPRQRECKVFAAFNCYANFSFCIGGAARIVPAQVKPNHHEIMRLVIREFRCINRVMWVRNKLRYFN